jgi:fused signal recognition particle receptor
MKPVDTHALLWHAQVGIVEEIGIPVKLVGVGEKLTDLKDFDATSFVDALLGTRVRIIITKAESMDTDVLFCLHE